MPAHGCEDSAGLSPDFPFTRDGAILRTFLTKGKRDELKNVV
jgi:hypothetical protein